MLFSFYDAVDWGVARFNDSIDFLRSVPSLLAPKPTTLGLPYSPPFNGGQLIGVEYIVTVKATFSGGEVQFSRGRNPANSIGELQASYNSVTGKINGATIDPPDGFGTVAYRINGAVQNYFQALNFRNSRVDAIQIISITRVDGQADSNENLPNPNPNPSINDDGLFTPNNPVIGDENGTVNPAAIILSPAAPLILIGGGLAAAAAAAAAAQAASDALAAIKKVAEALDALKELWKKLQEFLEEWEKDRPKNRDIVRQTYGSIEGDGAIDFYPLRNKNFAAIQVDIVVTEIPLGFGKYFGSMSPSRYRYKELGYISFYSINKGIIETHSIQFKRSSLAIPKTAIGFIYHFGLDNKIKGFAFGTFSVRKS